jgi:hypothetical protein
MITAVGLPVLAAPRYADERPIRQTPRQWLNAERGSLISAIEQACAVGLGDVGGLLALGLSGFLALGAHLDVWQHTLRLALGSGAMTTCGCAFAVPFSPRLCGCREPPWPGRERPP